MLLLIMKASSNQKRNLPLLPDQEIWQSEFISPLPPTNLIEPDSVSTSSKENDDDNASAESPPGSISAKSKTGRTHSQPLVFDNFEYNPLRTHTPTAIFYNIYIPEDRAGEKRALEIIADQMQQIKESYAVQGGKLTLYYVTIGKQLDASFMKKKCKKSLECQLVQHYAEGFEEVTLQRVSDFCRLDDHNDFRVMYIHSKGSYHPLEVKEFSQTAWRQNMMKAVTGKDCVMPPNGACSVCGLVALPFPMLHFPGNFFTATCDYVKRLVPPAEFGARMNEVVKSARLKHLEGQFGKCIECVLSRLL